MMKINSLYIIRFQLVVVLCLTQVGKIQTIQRLLGKARLSQQSMPRSASTDYYERHYSLPDQGNIWDYFVRNLKCNASYQLDKLGVLMFELDVEDGTSDRVNCDWNFFGSIKNKCTVSMICPKTVHFNTYPEPNSAECVENYLTLADGTSGKLTGCNHFTFADKPRIARNGGIDLYVSFKGKTEARNCFAFCTEDFKPNVTGLNETRRICSNKEWKGLKMEDSCMCGRRQNQGGSTPVRIVNGVDAHKFEFPWMGGLVLKEKETSGYLEGFGPNIPFCGGALINDRWFMTAGHCVTSELVADKEKQVLLHTHVIDRHLVAGEDPNDPFFQKIPGWNLPEETDESENRIRMDIEEVVVHPLLTFPNDDNVAYDVALIKLKIPIDFKTEKRVSPICLPEVNERFNYQDGEIFTVAGWGLYRDPDGRNARILQKLDTPFMNHAECKKRFSNFRAGLPFTHLCTGYLDASGNGTCSGDSGSPLIYKFDDVNYMAAGIVSFGYDYCAVKDYADTYTDLQEIVQWIYKTTSDATWCPRKP